jgi:hypothetical protein
MLTLVLAGAEIELDEEELTYNGARRRLDEIAAARIDYENGVEDEEGNKVEYKPFNKLSFKTAEGGRITVNPEKVIGLLSDQAKDVGSGE